MASIEDLLRLPVDTEVVEAQHDRYRRALPGHKKWAEVAKLCVDFYEGKQYTEEELTHLRSEGRPALTKNKIAPLVRLMLGFNRQNRYELKFMPGNDGTGTQDIAECITSVAKMAGEQNHSDWNDSDVFQDGIVTGRGFYDVRLGFTRNRLGDIKETVKNPFEMLIDPEAEAYNPNDEDQGWSFGMENRWMSLVDIATLYGEKGLYELGGLTSNLPIIGNDYYGASAGYDEPEKGFGRSEQWMWDYEFGNMLMSSRNSDHMIANRKLVRVLDCQHRVLKRCNYFIDLNTGQEKMIPDAWDREKIVRTLEWAKEKNLPISIGSGVKRMIRWTVTAADRVLHDKWSPYGDEYTFVPYFPYFRRGVSRGMIEDLLDPQRELNKRASALLHIVMTTANSGWIWEENALSEEMKQAIEEEGARPGINIEYRKGKPPPERIQPVQLPTAVKQLEIDATLDLKEISGINDSALGQIDRVQSGRAIMARQKQSMLGAEVYFDNFSRTRELKGLRYLHIIQEFYTEPRIIRVRDGSGRPQEYNINHLNAAGSIVNNVALGSYELAVEEAPISATFMQAQFQEALELVQAGVPIPPDVLIALSSMPNKEEIKERIDGQWMLQQAMAQMQAFGLSMQMGIPPGMPIPKISMSEGSPVQVVPLPMYPGFPAGPGGMGMMPPGAPPVMPGQAAPMGAPPAPGGAPGQPPPGAPPMMPQGAPGGPPSMGMPPGGPSAPPGAPQAPPQGGGMQPPPNPFRR